MAMVMNGEEQSHFATGGLKRTKSGTFSTQSHGSFSTGGSKSAFGTSSFELDPPRNTPSGSPGNSSPPTIHDDASYQSTPASSISLDQGCDDSDEEDQIVFPAYDDVGYYGQPEDLEPAASPRGSGESYTVSPTSNTASTDASRPDSPILAEHAEDDTALRSQPSRHVDYLSHNWREEDIWSSWQLIVSKRGTYSNSARLENASWRTWMKAKYKLKTVSPETLNWLKDCDVTWLYGPLQTGSEKPFMSTTSPQNSRISKSNSFIHSHKKPILKKRSMSELMLQRSLSASSLVRQAAAAVQAQQSGSTLRPCINRATSDYITFPFLDRRTGSAMNSSVLPSIESSGLTSPSYEKKHIHFNEQVEQCIALDIKGDDDEEIIDYGHDSDSDSDEGVMMKRTNSKRLLPPLGRRKPSRNNSSSNTNETKTIAVLPSTTLKYKDDEPELETAGSAQKHSGFGWKLSPSPSQETLRPSRPSKSSFMLNDESDDEMDLDWQPPAHSAFANRKDSISVAQDRMNGLQISGSGSNDAAGGSGSSMGGGMRRTESGMFMPIDPEDEEDAAVNEGLFGKVVDAVNTARDIGHVIWNVGWRR